MLWAAVFLVIPPWSPETSRTMLAAASGAAGSIKPGGNKMVDGCPASCGNLSFAYPFGIGSDCSRGSDFRLTCDDAARPPKLFLRDGITEVIDTIVLGSDGNYYGPDTYIWTSIWRTIPMKSGVHVYNLSLEPPGRSFSRYYTVLNITGCDMNVYSGDQTKPVCSTWCPPSEGITEMAARYNCTALFRCPPSLTFLSSVLLCTGKTPWVPRDTTGPLCYGIESP